MNDEEPRPLTFLEALAASIVFSLAMAVWAGAAVIITYCLFALKVWLS